MMVTIETPRLIIRPPTLNDAEAIHAAKDFVWSELQLWMSWAFDDQRGFDATKRFIESRNEGATLDDLPLIGLCKETGKFVISTGIHYRHEQHETGYWVAKDFLGKGYATEAANAVIRYALSRPEIEAIHISHFEGNQKSRRVIEKLCFTPTHINVKAHPRCSDGVPLDEHYYELRDISVLPPLDVSWSTRS